jgi:hypothetical protein
MILSISLATWVHFARPVRAQTMVERRKDYVQAARLLQIPARAIVMRTSAQHHQLVLVIATVYFGLAIITEATPLSVSVCWRPVSPARWYAPATISVLSLVMATFRDIRCFAASEPDRRLVACLQSAPPLTASLGWTGSASLSPRGPAP